MLKFHPSEWRCSKDAEYKFEKPTAIDTFISCTEMVVIKFEGIPIKSGTEFRFAGQFPPGLLTIKSKAEFGYKMTFKDAQSGEPLDDEEVVALAVAGNALQAIRRRAAREGHAVRQAMFNLQNYEIEDDDFRFEEDIVEAGRVSPGETQPEEEKPASQEQPEVEENNES